MGRQFIAVVPKELDQNVQLKQLVGKLKRTAEGRGQNVRWTPPALWHVTVQFLGDLLPEQTPSLKNLLEEWTPPRSMNLRMHGVGAFPSAEQGRVLWLGVQESQDFLDLQADLSARLKNAGFALSEREYKPHISLARFRNLMNLTDLVRLGGRKHFGDYAVSEVVLFESVLQGNIQKYMPQYRKVLRTSDNDSVQRE